MGRSIRVAAGQMGPIQRADSRAAVVERLMALLRDAKSAGCELVVFPELALTTFFARWLMQDQDEVDTWFEAEMPNEATQPLFDYARENQVGFYLGYAELSRERGRTRHFNSCILVDKSGDIVGKYRKIHLPGHSEPDDKRAYQHLEKRYFDVGDLGFKVHRAFGGNIGMILCNDRRWPETFRVLGMADVEMTLVGYNTPTVDAYSVDEPRLKMFHNHLSMQAGAYQNSTWVIGTAKAGVEDEHGLMGGSCIIAPSGEIVAQARTEGDELVVADCDLDLCEYYKRNIFNFAAHRRPEHYAAILERAARDGDSQRGGEALGRKRQSGTAMQTEKQP